MNTKFDNFLNEGLTHADLAKDLKDGAKFIQVEYIGNGKKWGVSYSKKGEKHEEGDFNTVFDVHNFLIENEIEYDGRQGFEMMRKYRAKQLNIPFKGYQDVLNDKGIEDML